MFPADGSPVKPYDSPDSAVFPSNQQDQHCSTWNKRRPWPTSALSAVPRGTPAG